MDNTVKPQIAKKSITLSSGETIKVSHQAVPSHGVPSTAQDIISSFKKAANENILPHETSPESDE